MLVILKKQKKSLLLLNNNLYYYDFRITDESQSHYHHHQFMRQRQRKEQHLHISLSSFTAAAVTEPPEAESNCNNWTVDAKMVQGTIKQKINHLSSLLSNIREELVRALDVNKFLEVFNDDKLFASQHNETNLNLKRFNRAQQMPQTMLSNKLNACKRSFIDWNVSIKCYNLQKKKIFPFPLLNPLPMH